MAGKSRRPRTRPLPGLRGKQRSIHNNYLTLPVVFAMISNHFPFTYGNPYGWLILVALMGLGAWVRHFFNLRNQGRVVWCDPGQRPRRLVVVVIVAAAPRPTPTPSRQRHALPRPRRLSRSRCQPCHSAQPTQPGYPQAPNGVMFDTPDQIVGRAQQIYQQAVVTKNMPLRQPDRHDPGRARRAGGVGAQGGARR